jgi:hypothetical protein
MLVLGLSTAINYLPYKTGSSSPTPGGGYINWVLVTNILLTNKTDTNKWSDIIYYESC